MSIDITDEQKRTYLTQNLWLCDKGVLKNIPASKPTKMFYNPNFAIPETEASCCDIHVNSKDQLTIAREMVQNGFNPVMISLMTDEFDGKNYDTSRGFINDNINLRTNIHRHLQQSTMYPIEKNKILYCRQVQVLRNESYDLNPNDMFRLGIILVNPVNEPRIVSCSNNILNERDYFTTKQTIEAIYQTAIEAGHDVLILNDFACIHNKIPIVDIIDLYNMMNLKYTAMLKYVIVCIPYDNSDDYEAYNTFNEHIIRIQDEIDSAIEPTHEDIAIN